MAADIKVIYRMPAVDREDEEKSRVGRHAVAVNAKVFREAVQRLAEEDDLAALAEYRGMVRRDEAQREAFSGAVEAPKRALARRITTDKGLLDVLGFSENEAAKILGRTRQSLYQAGLAKRDNYFKTNDLRSLVFEAKGQNRNLDLSAVLDYVRDTRGSDVADAIRAVSAHEAGLVDMSGYADLWIVLPDVAWLNRSYPDSMKQVVRFGALEGVRTWYFTASTMDRDLLKSALRTAGVAEPGVKAQDWMGAIPPLIIGDPQSRADIYLFNNGQFTSNDWYGGSKLVMLIQNLVDDRLRLAAEPVAITDSHKG